MSDNQSGFINRELSWLNFNQRVLDQSADASVPLLERIKFLAITCSNLDEFFMVRVGGLQLQQKINAASTDQSGMTASEQLAAIYDRTAEMVREQYRIFCEELEPQLEEHGIQRVHLSDASLTHHKKAKRIFRDQVFAVLSPMGLAHGEELPLLTSRSLYVCVQIAVNDEEQPFRFAVIPLGRVLPRMLTMPTEHGYSYALLEDVVREFVDDFFPGEEVLSTAAFRITRNADIALQEDSASDLIRDMKEVLQRRKSAECVRLEIDESAPSDMLEFLQLGLRITDLETVKSPTPMDLAFLMSLSDVEGFTDLRYSPWPWQNSPEIDASQSMFSTIAERDVLLSHPFESYDPVVRLIEEAAVDPDVLAIKQTLYRTSRKSAIVAALRRAAERGKYVTAIVELKARFDEARNIEWAEELEEAGVQVIYGVKNLKTHAKVCIIVRREPRGIVRYMHFGTGNYNESTARLYCDISYMTCNDKLGKDASAFFNAITGYSQPQQFTTLEAAPIGLRKRLLGHIEAEIERKKQGQRASIIAKLNALVDPQLIDALYRASQAGVTIQLNVRGICCLRPGVPGLSENISVTSIVDRLLEHARIMYFYHGGDEITYISSADWMPRNLDKRIELLVPVVDRRCKKRLISVLKSYFSDNSNSWKLGQDGEYQRQSPPSGEPELRAQEWLYLDAVEAVRRDEQKRRNTFEPHQPAPKQESD